MNRCPEALLFDLDGVLADVSRSYRRAIEQTVASFGATLDPLEVFAAKHEPGSNDDWELSRRLLARRGIEVPLAEVVARFEAFYQGSPGQPGLCLEERLLPEPGLLQRLGRRVRLGVVTGRPRADAGRFLRAAGVEPLFGVVITREDAPLKPDPAPVRLALARLGVRRAWMVGDTPDDIAAARAAGVLPLGVTAPGEEPRGAARALRAAGAARVLERLDVLEELLP